MGERSSRERGKQAEREQGCSAEQSEVSDLWGRLPQLCEQLPRAEL